MPSHIPSKSHLTWHFGTKFVASGEKLFSGNEPVNENFKRRVPTKKIVLIKEYL
jgi:hypothetical protein